MNLRTLKSVNNGHDVMRSTHYEYFRDIDNVVRIVGLAHPERSRQIHAAREVGGGWKRQPHVHKGRQEARHPRRSGASPLRQRARVLVVWAKEPFAQSPRSCINSRRRTLAWVSCCGGCNQNSPANQPIEYKNRDIYPQRTTGDTLIVVGKYIASAGTRGDIAHSADGRRVTGTVASAYEDEVKSINTILATNNNKVELVWVKDKAALVDEAASGQGLPGGLVGAFHGNLKMIHLRLGISKSCGYGYNDIRQWSWHACLVLHV